MTMEARKNGHAVSGMSHEKRALYGSSHEVFRKIAQRTAHGN